jgi:hypothetical protein
MATRTVLAREFSPRAVAADKPCHGWTTSDLCLVDIRALWAARANRIVSELIDRHAMNRIAAGLAIQAVLLFCSGPRGLLLPKVGGRALKTGWAISASRSPLIATTVALTWLTSGEAV